ncbi:S1C family serine protease [Kitasatospora cathayae]|uniref:Trypsin-like peptidase domain-containing protein n=1 Tax=Kitasatospora cathayae TaxID=3004092 RepID=A0ABY7Q493_9ACTN|nr:trypsin-like peptidase domain-containing protein [Kitasatospora sp. HUAS 3-15]WBP87541.1 trypsin-like peptidase domain-containing protein [Kitasatospora sp. HUAS 3-15]
MSEQQQHPDEHYGPYEQPRIIEGTVLGGGAGSTDPRTGYGQDHGYGYREDHSGGSFDGPPPPPPMPPEPPTLLGYPSAEGPEGPEGHGNRARRGLLRGRLALVTAVAAIAAVIGGVTGGVVAADRQSSDTRVGTIASPVSARTDGSANVPAIAAAVSPSVVQITVKSGNGTATGTGVVLNGSGQILTNYHVIDTANAGGRITVTFKDGSTAPATVTGTDKNLDVAVITATGARNLTPAVLGDSSTVAVGDPVVAIGNPDGLTGTVTSGIISAENRDVTVQLDEGTTSGNGGFGFPNLPGLRGSLPQQQGGGDTTTYKAFQTDAALNPGNSGGPLINANGQVIAINSAMYAPNGANSTAGGGSSTAGSVGLGFAIPINDIKQVLPKLEAGERL